MKPPQHGRLVAGAGVAVGATGVCKGVGVGVRAGVGVRTGVAVGVLAGVGVGGGAAQSLTTIAQSSSGQSIEPSSRQALVPRHHLQSDCAAQVAQVLNDPQEEVAVGVGAGVGVGVGIGVRATQSMLRETHWP